MTRQNANKLQKHIQGWFGPRTTVTKTRTPGNVWIVQMSGQTFTSAAQWNNFQCGLGAPSQSNPVRRRPHGIAF